METGFCRYHFCIVLQPHLLYVLTLHPSRGGAPATTVAVVSTPLKTLLTSPWPNPRSTCTVEFIAASGCWLTALTIAQPYQPQPDLQGSPQWYQEASKPQDAVDEGCTYSRCFCVRDIGLNVWTSLRLTQRCAESQEFKFNNL